jgi:hypothetical protein
MIPFHPAYRLGQIAPKKYLACPLGSSGLYNLLDPDTGELVQSQASLTSFDIVRTEFLSPSDPRCIRYSRKNPSQSDFPSSASGPGVNSAAIFKIAAMGGLIVYLSYSLVKRFWK